MSNEQLKQMDIWENKVVILLLIGEQLEVGVYDDANINKAKKRVMWYHWSNDNMFFQNLIILKLVKRKSLIENVLEAIDDYSKWCEAQPIKEHDVITTSKFLENEMIYRYGLFNNILMNNGTEWMKEFAKTCQNYGINH